MERNPNERLGNTTPGQPGGSTTGAGNLGTGGAGGAAGSGFGGTSPGGSFGGTQGQQSGGQSGALADRPEGAVDQAKERVQQAREQASHQLGRAREKAHDFRLAVADKLEAGAERLRQRGRGGDGGALAGAAGDGGIGVQSEDRLQRVSSGVADGLQSSADWLRENDLDAMRSGVERQVRENPGRSLLVALGLGYVLGKAFRK